MIVKELRDILKGFDDDVEVMTKKTEFFGNVGYVNSVRKDSYGFFRTDVPCVLLTDEFESQESEVRHDKERRGNRMVYYVNGEIY